MFCICSSTRCVNAISCWRLKLNHSWRPSRRPGGWGIIDGNYGYDYVQTFRLKFVEICVGIKTIVPFCIWLIHNEEIHLWFRERETEQLRKELEELIAKGAGQRRDSKPAEKIDTDQFAKQEEVEAVSMRTGGNGLGGWWVGLMGLMGVA